jgi:hypothetical protein
LPIDAGSELRCLAQDALKARTATDALKSTRGSAVAEDL